MSPYYLSCVLCGYRIGGGQAIWQNEFRGACIVGHKWSEHYLSGVGLSTDPDFSIWTAPRNADARYDDRNYKASARDNIHPRTPVFTRMTGGPIVIDPDQPAIEDEPWGFLVHDSCWSLFQSVLQPWVVPVGVFVEFCRSCPWSFGFLNWGHDYGGIVTFKFDPSDLLTGEDKSIDGYKEALPGFRHHIAALSMFADPYKIPELLLCLAETNRTALNDVDAPAHSACIAAIRDRPECFLQLPPEISEAIVLQLKSTDLCNLRLASRAFAAMPLPQAFWASRFQSGFEFESVIEVQSTSFRQQNRDWKMLYHRVKALLATPSLSNRNRIWGILRPLADLLKCYSSLSLAGYAYPSFYDPDVPKSHDHPWTCIQGAVERPKGYFFGGCMVLFERTVSIPRDMTGLHVSVVHFSGTHYISGLRFVRQHGGDVCIGYNIPDNEVLLSLDGNSQSDSFGGVKGFEVAVGRRGIHAIALVSSTGIMSAWAGHPEEAPQMRLRTRLDRISALKAGFDGFKMVTLGIPDDAADELVVMSGTGSRPLRESAQWVPDVPADSLCLNEGIFIGAEREEQEYQPLYYILFGGPEGSYRKNLIRIGVWMSEFGLYGIEFEYNTEIDGRRIHTLGRCGPLTEKTNNGLENADDNAMESFDVDGPHGETIKTVKVEPSDNIKGIEFGTNRGRKKLISTNWGAPLLPLAIAPTSSITGIYVAIGQALSFEHLGIMSAELD